MAEMTIRLRTDPATGKKDVLVDLKSDEDALPHEHEERHRALVHQLIEGGLLKAEELGKIVVERDRPEAEPSQPTSSAPTQERGPLSQDH
ncbi:MAG: hypothetical protein AB7I30_20340 [Isosphaeraceae bacterium]